MRLLCASGLAGGASIQLLLRTKRRVIRAGVRDLGQRDVERRLLQLCSTTDEPPLAWWVLMSRRTLPASALAVFAFVLFARRVLGAGGAFEARKFAAGHG